MRSIARVPARRAPEGAGAPACRRRPVPVTFPAGPLRGPERQIPMARRTLTLLVCLLAAASPVLAQQGTAEVRGQVTDAQQAVLPGATVTLRHQESGMFRQGTTTAEGMYFLSGVMPGLYELTAELAGFKKYARPNLRVEVGRTATVDVQLEVGGLEEQMTVTAEPPLVDVTSKEVGGHIS